MALQRHESSTSCSASLHKDAVQPTGDWRLEQTSTAMPWNHK
jgi:hypothetical protein